MKEKKFIISTHGFDMGIGGLKVLHKLCHLLNEKGFDAYLIPVNFDVPFVTYSGYNTKIVTQEILNNLNDCIVVYPESWFGNYLNAPNVVRWMIGFPSKPHIDTWNESDLWFWYVSYYITEQYNKNRDNILYVGEQHSDIFHDYKINRNGTCWTLRKAQGIFPADKYVHDFNSTFIPYHAAGDLTGLAQLFNSRERFYCYDNYTYLTIQSLMCNTDTIIIPYNTTKEEFINGYELNKYIAFGVDDLPRAKSIRNELWYHLEEIEQTTDKQIDLFIEKCYDYFK
jgi:hypothetical protein